MIDVSEDFKDAISENIKELQGYIRVDDLSITDSTDLIKWKISAEGALLRTVMRKFEGSYLGDENLLGKWVHVGFSVRKADNTFESIDYGTFLISEISYQKDTDTTTISGYDRMINAMSNYQQLDITYPIQLYEYSSIIADSISLNLLNQSFDVLDDWNINEDLWINIDGITFRDILQQIAEVTCTVAMIDNNDNLVFKSIYDTESILTYNNLISLKLEEKFGAVNSVSLSRENITGEDVIMQDDNDIDENGLCQISITSNEIIDDDRENAITSIYNSLHGLEYYPFEARTEGLGYFEVGDRITIVDDNDTEFSVIVFEFSIELDGCLIEILKSQSQPSTQAQYQYLSKIDRRIKNTEIKVDKQQQLITSIVSDLYDEDGQVNETFTEIRQDLTSIINTVQKSGGSNMLLNSVMFKHTDNSVESWELDSNGSIVIHADTDSLTFGCLSGNIFKLIGKTVKQKIFVKPNDENIMYSFSCNLKKGLGGTCYIKIYNDLEEYSINLTNEDICDWESKIISNLYPTQNYYYIELYASSDSDVYFTDIMFALGDVSSWCQANGEVMNTQVNISENGVIVKSNRYLGDYTVISPLEFAGYSTIGNTVTRVFSLNKDTTQVSKLKSENEITMPPIKIIPVTSGTRQGWAFVPTSNNEN